MTEDQYLPTVCRACHVSIARLDLKGKARTKYAEAFMQGVLSTATVAGWMTTTRAEQIAFLCMVGRLDEFIAARALMNLPKDPS